MAEDQSLPDWLVDIEEPPPEGEPLEEVPQPVVDRWVEDSGDEAAQPEAAQPEVVQPEVVQPDVVGDLREYIAPEEPDYAKPTRTGVFPGMKPWQGLVLALLLFADVLVCGCMALVMLGRVKLPF
jgi:hypothetical protein